MTNWMLAINFRSVQPFYWSVCVCVRARAVLCNCFWDEKNNQNRKKTKRRKRAQPHHGSKKFEFEKIYYSHVIWTTETSERPIHCLLKYITLSYKPKHSYSNIRTMRKKEKEIVLCWLMNYWSSRKCFFERMEFPCPENGCNKSTDNQLNV